MSRQTAVAAGSEVGAVVVVVRIGLEAVEEVVGSAN